MTALTDFQRLEAQGSWRAAPDAPLREVIVSVGDATLVLSDPRTDRPLSHWSLPAVVQLNPGVTPAIYAPTTTGEDETVTIDDPLMIEAIARVQGAVASHRAHTGRLRNGLLVLAILAALGWLVFWLPGALVAHAARIAPPAQARDMGWREATDEVALIEVSDTGPGVPTALLDKIFEPFFTTKAVNEGTGMGLATVYGIAQQAGGHITVANLENAGAAFRIFLPAATAEELVEAPVVEKVVKAPRDLSGAGRILFVEDEAAVRGIAARLLRQRGYEVIEAADGEEALILAEEWAGQIDMLISDVIMPGLDGPSLLRKARPFLGDAPVMFISGYAESDFSDLLQDEVGVSFLPKPLDIKTLAERVKQELHAG